MGMARRLFDEYGNQNVFSSKKSSSESHIEKNDSVYFDYIVIGAGTAGGVVAKELSDDYRLLYSLLSQEQT